VLILNHGRLIADGTVAEVTRRAAAPRDALLRVPADAHERARQALALAGIPVRASELEGARLSDAFLAMTESG
jgi:ABC-2 type transport system ATP-binding protein